MTFKKAVEAAPQPLNSAYRPGKQALESRHRGLVTCANSRRLTGSIFLDAALAQEPGYADKPRWDYGLGYYAQERTGMRGLGRSAFGDDKGSFYSSQETAVAAGLVE